MIESPCMDCKKRKVLCHITCEDYLNYKKELEIEHEKIRKINNIASDFYAYNEAKYKRIKNNTKKR